MQNSVENTVSTFQDFPDLTRFMAPHRLAIVGATEDLSKFGGRCMQQALSFGFKGQVLAVNPKRRSVFGAPCFPTISDLPETPDHVGLVLPAAAVPGALEECAQKGVPFVTVFSSGFSETSTVEGQRLQQEILDIAQRNRIRMMGPNCNGLVNFVDRFALTSTATIRGGDSRAGDVGIVSQSGGAGQVNVMWRAQQAGIDISYQVSCGNACDLDIVDYAAFMLNSDSTKVVLMLVERIVDGGRLHKLAELSHQLNKPVVMVKIGRTRAGSVAAASHTGAITGADEVCDAALKQLGILRVDDCNELYETAMILRQQKVCRGNRAAATSISGGNLVMVADLGEMQGIEWPNYSAQTCEKIESLLPGFGKPTNPTDLTAAAIGQPGTYAKAVEVILDDPLVDTLIPVLTMAHSAEIKAVADIARRSSKPVPILWTGGVTDTSDLKPSDLVREGLAVFSDSNQCVKAIARMMTFESYRGKSRRARANERPLDIKVNDARDFLKRSNSVLNETDGKKLLQFYGIKTTSDRIALDEDQAAQIWRRMSVPVALKIQSEDIPHKTDIGCVSVGLNSESDVRRAFVQIMENATGNAPQARLDGVVVQEMIPDSLEFIIGMTQDSSFGPVLTFGMGGIFVEVFKDVKFLLPPVTVEMVRESLAGLKCYPLLKGTRGHPERDIEQLIETIVRISWLSHDLGDLISEIDINPVAVLVKGNGIKVIDTLVVKKSD